VSEKEDLNQTDLPQSPSYLQGGPKKVSLIIFEPRPR